ncbi:MAG: dienelactone hydrolase family protein, partial [Betaproteobacteria bacterium]|nr:dienelactone hydrolase family protein [Betaproteobacteria bacterium]
MGTVIELKAADGHALDAYRADPRGKPRGGLVMVQEIFGVNSHIRAVADDYAAEGYSVIAPALFDRIQRGYETGYAPQEIEAGRKVMQAMKWEHALADVAAACEALKPAGKVGI